MKAPEDVRALLTRRFSGNHREWLAGTNADAWPLEVPLSLPSEEEAYRDLEGVRAWIRAWQAWAGPGSVEWTERRWRSLGIQRVPERLVLADAADVAACAGQGVRWKRAVMRYAELKSLWPTLGKPLLRYFDVLADYSDPEFLRLVGMLKWLSVNPASHLYPRQIPLAGLNSKWLEVRKGLISDLVAAIQNDPEVKDFYSRCGLRPLPALVRLRVLDPGLRRHLGGLSDISAVPQEIASLSLPVERIFIVENVQSGLAFPDMQGAVVFMGLGYSVDLLGGIGWMEDAMCFYWGDCDTHGFAILSRARSYRPRLQSLMMDKGTLLAHKSLWGKESEQHGARDLPHLTEEEQSVYQGLKDQHWGQNVQLEQERIAWDYAVPRISG